MPAAARTRARRPAERATRTQDPDGTRRNIIEVATREFAEYGLAGARIDEIAAATQTSKRMIYYYFGSKEGLFIAVIEEIYRRFNEAESELALDLEAPTESLVAIVRFIWSYYNRHPEFITLLNSENLHRGKHISKSRRPGEYSSPALSLLERVLHSGARQGVFRGELRARDVYLLIASLGYFYLSNRHTLSTFLGEDLEAPEALEHWERFVIDSVLRVVAAGQPPPPLASSTRSHNRSGD